MALIEQLNDALAEAEADLFRAVVKVPSRKSIQKPIRKLILEPCI